MGIVIKKTNLSFVLALFMLIFCTISIIALSIMFGVGSLGGKAYIIKTIQSVVLAFCFFVPFLFEKFNLRFGLVVLLNYYLFMFIAIFVGSIINIYDEFWPFDIIVHFYSGVLFGLVSITLAKNLSNKLLQFVFCIAIATLIGVIWEFYEFSFDRLLGLNMQRTANVKTLEPFIGWHAISDTMLDLLCDFSGGVLAASLCFASVTKNKNYIIAKK